MLTKNNKAEQLISIGCIVCSKEGHGYSAPEIHHLRNGQGVGQRSDDDHAIPLCSLHHRLGGYGVAFHAGRVAFESRYGTELELLAEVNHRLSRDT